MILELAGKIVRIWEGNVGRLVCKYRKLRKKYNVNEVIYLQLHSLMPELFPLPNVEKGIVEVKFELKAFVNTLLWFLFVLYVLWATSVIQAKLFDEYANPIPIIHINNTWNTQNRSMWNGTESLLKVKADNCSCAFVVVISNFTERDMARLRCNYRNFSHRLPFVNYVDFFKNCYWKA